MQEAPGGHPQVRGLQQLYVGHSRSLSSHGPRAPTSNSNRQFDFTLGASDLQGNTPVYLDTVTFDGTTDHKIDSRAAGRYLSYKMTVTDGKDFDFIGFDADVMTTGRR